MDTRWSEENTEAEPTPADGANQPRPSFDEIKARLEGWSLRARTLIQERPAACLLGAVAVGYLVARVARRGR